MRFQVVQGGTNAGTKDISDSKAGVCRWGSASYRNGRTFSLCNPKYTIKIGSRSEFRNNPLFKLKSGFLEQEMAAEAAI
ncbi:MAG: hypothetical protein WBB25_08170 [Sulfitobacter sp.]